MIRKRYNCPNCGAGITGERCEFCGTVIYDFAALEIGAPSFVKIMHNGTIHMFRMIVDEFSMSFERDAVEILSDYRMPFECVTASEHLNVSLNAHCVPMDAGALMVQIKTEDK